MLLRSSRSVRESANIIRKHAGNAHCVDFSRKREMTTYAELKKLVSTRLDDAQALFAARRFAGAYYIAGYSVECGIKVVIAKQFKARDIPNKKKVVDIHTHSLGKLISEADLKVALDVEIKGRTTFAANWQTVSAWSEVARYNPAIKKIEARDMLDAITDPSDGVMQWLTRHW